MESLDNVKKIIEDLLAQEGYSLFSFKLNSGTPKNLEITIDREEPINLDDITLISQKISKTLDEHEFTTEKYFLDISSLGAEKPIDIKNLEKYLGKYVNIHTTHPYKGLSYLEGTLTEVKTDSIELLYFVKGKKTKTLLEREFIDKARLAIKF